MSLVGHSEDLETTRCLANAIRGPEPSIEDDWRCGYGGRGIGGLQEDLRVSCGKHHFDLLQSSEAPSQTSPLVCRSSQKVNQLGTATIPDHTSFILREFRLRKIRGELTAILEPCIARDISVKDR